MHLDQFTFTTQISVELPEIEAAYLALISMNLNGRPS